MMSISRCESCNRQVDTDDDVDCYDSEGQCFCESCRDKQFEEGREMARDYHLTVMEPRGCTCRWVGANGDPDQHIKRDHDCQLHGRDPDAARDARMDQ